MEANYFSTWNVPRRILSIILSRLLFKTSYVQIKQVLNCRKLKVRNKKEDRLHMHGHPPPPFKMKMLKLLSFQGTSLPWTPCQGPSWTHWWPKAVPKSNKNAKMRIFAYTGVPSPFSLLNSSTESEHN